FFVDRVRRSESQLETTVISNQPSIDIESSTQLVRDSQYLQWFSERFGIDSDIFSSFQLWIKGKDKIWLADASCQPLSEEEIQT
ncbi:hypothetical protein R0K19_26130, partial [Bacillus sp. SIMBA_161]